MSAARKLAPWSVPGIRSWRHRMAGHDLRQRVEVSDDDRTVATAEVTTSEGSGGTARVSLRAEPGHITPGRRASLIDAVLDLLGVQGSALVEAAFRLGDSESLHRLQERCEDASTRPAGWSALVDAHHPSSRARAARPRLSRQATPAGRITTSEAIIPSDSPAAARASTKPASSSSSTAARAADQRRPARAAAEAGGALAGAHLGGRGRGAGGHC
jgi:hypothetical protein